LKFFEVVPARYATGTCQSVFRIESSHRLDRFLPERGFDQAPLPWPNLEVNPHVAPAAAASGRDLSDDRF
jgi:hypothetical protein